MQYRIIFALAATALAAPFSAETIHEGVAPVLSYSNTEVIPGSYIIRFKSHVSEAAVDEHQNWIQSVHAQNEEKRLELKKRNNLDIDTIFEGVKHTYKVGNFLGYAGRFDDDVIEKVRRHPDVESVVQDSVVHALKPVEVKEVEDKCDGELEKNSPWGLARISHRDTLSFSTYNKYLYAAEGGEGVDAYIIDTGTNVDHVDFEGRAHWGKTIPTGDPDEDGNGHGTHCSGTVGGKKYGVAKKANIYAVKVLRSNGSGTMMDVAKGVEWAATQHLKKAKEAKDGKHKGFKGSVANLSLGGGRVPVLDDVINAAVDAGLHVAVASGNDNDDACNYSPAAAEKAISVAASTLDDSRAYFSNYGKCVHIFAPGMSIRSTWIGSKYAVNTISGTSMASPHIAGLLAYYLSLQPAADSEYAVEPITPEALKKTILSIATEGAVTDVPKGTPNLLAWNGGGCDNFSAIVEAGGYKAKKKEGVASDRETSIVSEIEKLIQADVKVVSGKIVMGANDLADKAEKVTEKISNKVHDFVESELKDAFRRE